MAETVLDTRVFQIRAPPCEKCGGEIDFKIIEDYHGTSTDRIRWYCKDPGCGAYIDVELI